MIDPTELLKKAQLQTLIDAVEMMADLLEVVPPTHKQKVVDMISRLTNMAKSL